MRRFIGAIAAVCAACVVTAPVAAAKVTTTTKTFTLKAGTTKTYAVAGGRTTVEDAGYVLAGPGFKLREDNLVDPYPAGGKAGLVTKGSVEVIAVGLGKTQPPKIEVRVKTGKLSGAYTLKLYIKNVT